MSRLLHLGSDEHTGRTLGKYEIICRLSVGGMSEIFLGLQQGLAGFRKLVVLKQILPAIKADNRFIQMFFDEGRITAAFNHPNIAQVYDLDVAEGDPFLAIEFVAGATLLEVLKELGPGKIPIGFTLAVIRDVAFALHYAHTFTDPMGKLQQVIHRDVAEKNVMVTYEGRSKLLDFGIAKQLGGEGRTQVGTTKGTRGYMSPEQIRGQPLDPRSDVFSLGATLHQCLTGVRLYTATDPEEEMAAPLLHPAAPPSLRRKEISPALDAVVLKALERDRTERFASARDFGRAIEQLPGNLLWDEEQRGAFIQRHFADRREQTQALLARLYATAKPSEPAAGPSAAPLMPELQEEPRTIIDAGLAGQMMKAAKHEEIADEAATIDEGGTMPGEPNPKLPGHTIPLPRWLPLAAAVVAVALMLAVSLVFGLSRKEKVQPRVPGAASQTGRP